MDRTLLDAFADGALSPEESARVVMHLADCPGDSTYVDAVVETNELLAAAYAAPLYEPLPERFRAAIFPDAGHGAAPVGSGWRARARGAPLLLGGALAASLALAIGLTALPAWRDATVGLTSTAGAASILNDALESHPSGPVMDEHDTIEITLIGTFFDRDGRPCREYESLDNASDVLIQGVACHAGAEGWTTEVAVANRIAGDAARAESYVPADGAVSAAFDGALDRLGAGMALSASEERLLIAGNWKR